MNKRKWILKLATALIVAVLGVSAYAADNSFTASSSSNSSGSDLLLSPDSLFSQTNNNLGNEGKNLSSSDTAIDVSDTHNVYVDTPNDYSIKYLNMLFGNVGNTLRGSVSGQTVGHLFYIFNQGVLIACGIWVLLTLIRIFSKLLDGNVQEISKEGKTFLSICLGIVLVIPSPRTGYSTIQDIIMKVVVQGVKLANGIWNYQITAFENHVHVFDNPPQQSAWAGSDEEKEVDYKYNYIMQETIPSKIDSSFYRLLNAEINYYQSEIQCKNIGSDACGDTPHPLIADSTNGGNNTSSITINQSYPEASAANPVTFTAAIQLNNSLAKSGSTTPNNVNPFNANLYNAAQTLSATAKSYACQASPDSAFCAGVPPVDLTNAANQIIALSSEFANNINNVYTLDQLENDSITDTDNIQNTQTCYARWQKDSDLLNPDNLAKYNQEMEQYNKDLADYEIKHASIINKMNNLKDDDLYKQYNDGLYKSDYEKMENEGCASLMSCNMNSKDYMNIGDVGGWGKEDFGGIGGEPSYDTRLANCMDWIKHGRKKPSTEDTMAIRDALNGIDNGYTVDTATQTAHDRNGVAIATGGEALTTGNTGKALYPDASDDQLKALCQNYGSILYQIWRDSDRLTQAQKSELQTHLPTQEEMNDAFTPPKHPQLVPNYDTADRQSCTQVLATKMRNSGWIMAGAYYWLIAHQDQEMVTVNAAKGKNFIDWSVGHKMAAALAAFTLTGGDNNNNNDNGGSGAGSETPSCEADKEGATTANLSSCVKHNIQEQFRDNGTDMGQIDTISDSPGGVSAQLAWAGNAFNAIISGESDSIDSAPYATGTANETSALASKNNNLGKYGQSVLGSLYKAQSSLFPQLINQIYFMQKFILNVANQLNNPNIDPQSILASIGMGMIYQGGYATIGYMHMMITLVIVVLVGLVAIALLIMIPVAGSSLAIITGAPLAMLMTFAKVMGSILKKIGITFMAMGAVMAFYVPIYPWIVFTFAAVGWFIAVIEAMAAGPLICLGMTHPQGQELASSLKQSIMLLLGVFIRPALMILSFIMSMILARVLLFFMIQGFLMLLGTLFDSNANDYCRYVFNSAISSGNVTQKAECSGGYGTSINLWSSMFNLSLHASDIAHEQYSTTITPLSTNIFDTSSGALDQNIPYAYRSNTSLDGRPNSDGYRSIMQFIMMMLSMPIMLGILTYMTYKIINHAYSLVFLVPENTLKWIGAQTTGSTQSLMQSAEGSKESASKAAQSGSKGVEKSMQSGESSATSAMKSGGSAGIQTGAEIGKKGMKGKK